LREMERLGFYHPIGDLPRAEIIGNPDGNNQISIEAFQQLYQGGNIYRNLQGLVESSQITLNQAIDYTRGIFRVAQFRSEEEQMAMLDQMNYLQRFFDDTMFDNDNRFTAGDTMTGYLPASQALRGEAQNLAHSYQQLLRTRIEEAINTRDFIEAGRLGMQASFFRAASLLLSDAKHLKGQQANGIVTRMFQAIQVVSGKRAGRGVKNIPRELLP